MRTIPGSRAVYLVLAALACAAPAMQDAPRLFDVTPARGVSAGQPVGAAETFTPETNPIYVFFRHERIPPGTEVLSRWYYFGTTPPTTITEATITIQEPASWAQFNLELAEGKRWPQGRYRVDIFVAGALAAEARFDVRVAAGAIAAPAEPKSYIHPRTGFEITPPPGWTLTDEIEHADVQMKPSEGDGLIEIVSGPVSMAIDPLSYAAGWESSSVGPGKRLLRKRAGHSITIGPERTAGYAGVYEGEGVLAKVVFVSAPGRQFVLTAVFKAEDFEAGEAVFDRLVQSFRSQQGVHPPSDKPPPDTPQPSPPARDVPDTSSPPARPLPPVRPAEAPVAAPPAPRFTEDDPCDESRWPAGDVPWRTPVKSAPADALRGEVAPAALGAPLDINTLTSLQYAGAVSAAMESLRLMYGELTPEDTAAFERKWAPLFDFPTSDVVAYLNRLNPLLAGFLAARAGYAAAANSLFETLNEGAFALVYGSEPDARQALESARPHRALMQSYQARLAELAREIDALGNPPNPYALKCAARKRAKEALAVFEGTGKAAFHLYIEDKRIPAADDPQVCGWDGSRPLVGATVSIEGPAGASAITDSAGTARFSALPAGRYRVRITDPDGRDIETLARGFREAHPRPPVRTRPCSAAEQAANTPECRPAPRRSMDVMLCDDFLSSTSVTGITFDSFALEGGASTVERQISFGALLLGSTAPASPTSARVSPSPGTAPSERTGPATPPPASFDEDAARRETIQRAMRRVSEYDRQISAEADPDRRSELEFLKVIAVSEIQMEQAQLQPASPEAPPFIRTALSDYVRDREFQKSVEEAARSREVARLHAGINRQIAILPEELQADARSDVNSLLDANQIGQENPDDAAKALAMVSARVQGYWSRESARQTERAEYYEWVENTPKELSRTAIGIAFVGLSAPAAAAMFGGTSLAAAWAPTAAGFAYGGVTGYQEGGPVEAVKGALTWSSAAGFAGVEAFTNFEQELQQSGDWKQAAQAGAARGLEVYAAGKVIEKTLAFGASLFGSRGTPAFQPDMARYQRELQSAEQRIARFRQVSEDLDVATRSGAPAEHIETLGRLQRETAADINVSYQAKLRLKLLDKDTGRAYTKVISGVYDEMTARVVSALEKKGYDASALRLKPIRNVSSGGSVGMDFDLMLDEQALGLLKRNGQPVSRLTFERDGQQAMNDVYFGMTGRNPEASFLNFTTSLHPEAYKDLAWLGERATGRINFAAIDPKSVPQAGEVTAFKTRHVLHASSISELSRVQEAGRGLVKDLDTKLLPYVDSRIQAAAAAGDTATMRKLESLREHWKTVRAEYAAIASPGADANELMAKIRELRARGLGLDTLANDISLRMGAPQS